MKQQMAVIAKFSDGSMRDVSAEAFVESSNTEVATADRSGRIKAIRRGETAILARFEGNYAAASLIVMGNREGFAWQPVPEFNYIDSLVYAKLKEVKIQPSDVCADADFIRRLKSDSTALRILGDGTQKKSYVHVDDVLDAIFLVAANAGEPYDVFNVATDDYITVRQIADLAVTIAGLRPEEVRYEFSGGDRGWKGDVPIVRFDCSKIKALGWRNRRSSADALRDAMEAMRREIENA